jgi:glyoxylase-like metal-dependent hydrolase (beta-lactamase superfamily II)
MNTHRLLSIFLVLLIFTAASAPEARAQAAPLQMTGKPAFQGKAYRFDKISDGVYYATATGTMITGGNNVVIVNDREMLAEIKMITPNPVRFVVDTHFHYDHTDGNMVYAPTAEIIAIDYVREMLAHHDVLHTEPYKTSVGSLPTQLDALKKQAAAEKDPAKHADLEKQVKAMQDEIVQVKETKPTPPTMTFKSQLTLYRGNREIQLLFLGRGHTEGDTVVYLPKEKIVCTGDLMESRPAYMGSAVFDEWIKTLGALKKLDFNTVLPGHGVPFHDKALITAWQSYLQDLITQVAALRKQGLTADQAAQKVDLRSHASAFPQITAVGADLRGVRRVYEWMDETNR